MRLRGCPLTGSGGRRDVVNAGCKIMEKMLKLYAKIALDLG